VETTVRKAREEEETSTLSRRGGGWKGRVGIPYNGSGEWVSYRKEERVVKCATWGS